MNVYLVNSRPADPRRDGSPGAFYSVRFFSASPSLGPALYLSTIGRNPFLL
ncbi:MAG: hypothetical protein AVDCRST_MAG78-2228 [uncultured Rubrobacteraceae bacterium]|uniref:Uncharacterized protein n=1 Tax=uncultured Rubrobacteraceae bacterium TaxID=349277 RepID=A0A6J4QAQ5_9ACTN|nr:MAG: hypothetical protein AVDCRST_MAG78-2228 [uncultured Rubrobacteraceae bacterium]